MAMNRSGWSLPAGPASTPQASSGWSARAWATIWSYSARGIVSTRTSLRPHPASQRSASEGGWGGGWGPGGERGLVERLDQRLLHRAEPGIHLERGPLRIIRLQPRPLVLEVLGDAQPDPEREPDVVQ